MRPTVASAALVAILGVGCAEVGPRPQPERTASAAVPEPDPACRTLVARSLALNALERVTVRVAIGGDRAAVDLLAPELTPAAAEDVRRAFVDCAWRPGPGGATDGEVTFTRR
jgi:hypothetical protein